MPIYEYECKKCGVVFEVMQSISAKPLTKHTENQCNGKVQRVVSRSGFILKGDGWYVTDYPSEARKKGWEEEGGSKPAAPAATGDAATPSAPAETKTPAPASKTPAPAPAPKKTKNPYTGGSKKSKAKQKTSK